MTNIDLKQMLFDQRMKEIENDVVPFGFHDDGSTFANSLDQDYSPWAVEYDRDL